MKFARRLRLYLMGVLLGCVLVVFFFRDRLSVLTSWLPNDRVLLRLKTTLVEVDPAAECYMHCAKLDSSDLDVLFENGDVRFNLSETHEQPLKYVVDERLNDRLVRFSFEAADSTAILRKIEFPNGDLSCDCP